MSDDQIKLFGDEPPPAPTSKGRGKKPKVDRRTDEDRARAALHQRVVDLYVSEFKRARNVDVVLFDAADGAATKRLIDKMGGDEVQVTAVIRSAFTHKYQRQFVTIRDIASNPMRYLRGESSNEGHMQRGNVAPSRNDCVRKPEDY